MNRKEFFAIVVSRLDKHFADLGFIYKSSFNGFLKLIEDGWMCVSFEFYKSAGLGNFIVGFEVRKDRVQDVLFKYVEINPADQKKAPTFAFTLHRLLREKENAYRFETEEQLVSLLEQKVVPFLETQLPYFIEKCSDLKSLYTLFSDENELYNKLVWPTYDNYIKLLVMGWLLHPEDLNKIAAHCNELFLSLKRKWPEQLDVELYENNFHNIIEDLIKANGIPEKTGSYWSVRKGN